MTPKPPANLDYLRLSGGSDDSHARATVKRLLKWKDASLREICVTRSDLLEWLEKFRKRNEEE